MKDAGIEAKRDTLLGKAGLSARLGEYQAAVQSALSEAENAKVIQRIWEKDASLWKQESAHQKIIKTSLGWLTVPGDMLSITADLEAFAARIRSEGYQHVMVCGMGGSSLCPEVLRQTFGSQKDFPKLLVLDSTDPDVIANFAKEIDVGRCLFIIASKSGTTTEPTAFHRYWYNEVAQNSDSPGDSFVAITDPGTQMAAIAAAEKFKHTFLNQPDIGGRYSALSYFGMLPASLMGLSAKLILQQAHRMAEACQAAASANPAAILGAIMAECALAGRDKLTFIIEQELSALGLWIEQLVAESSGKEGKGIIPVIGEPLGDTSAYGDDRLFVSIAVGDSDYEADSQTKSLEAAGHPVVYRTLSNVYEIGAEFFIWEMATAFAGWRLAINPFDQPNVQESKDATRALLERYKTEGKLEEQTPIASDGTLKIFNDSAPEKADSPAEALRQHIAKVKPGNYVALLAYIEQTPELDSLLQTIRMSLRQATGCATTVGYGPRFLHSTGQLHKGGPDSGVFIQLTAPDKVDFAVPGEPYTFSILKQAQAQGDFQSLLVHGRRAIRVDLGDDLVAGLTRLEELMQNGGR